MHHVVFHIIWSSLQQSSRMPNPFHLQNHQPIVQEDIFVDYYLLELFCIKVLESFYHYSRLSHNLSSVVRKLNQCHPDSSYHNKDFLYFDKLHSQHEVQPIDNSYNMSTPLHLPKPTVVVYMPYYIE